LRIVVAFERWTCGSRNFATGRLISLRHVARLLKSQFPTHTNDETKLSGQAIEVLTDKNLTAKIVA
jgi:hypothetical protein